MDRLASYKFGEKTKETASCFKKLLHLQEKPFKIVISKNHKHHLLTAPVYLKKVRSLRGEPHTDFYMQCVIMMQIM